MISILTVNYNGIQHLKDCFESIFNQTFLDYEVVMVDNGSKDESVDFVRKNFPKVKIVIAGKNLGFAGGNNFGLKYCEGEHIFFLNNDVKVAPEALAELNKIISTNNHYQIFAPFLISLPHPDKADSAGDGVYTWGPVYSHTGYPISQFLQQREVASACGGAALYARSVLNEIGVFDEDFFLNFEDLDLGFRARHAGYRTLFLPSVKVFHKGSATLGGKKSYLSTYYSERNYLWFIIKNFPGFSFIRFIPSILFVKIARLISMTLHGQLKAYIYGNLDSFRGIPKMWRKRRTLIPKSKMSQHEFWGLLRKNWPMERIRFKMKDYRGVP